MTGTSEQVISLIRQLLQDALREAEGIGLTGTTARVDHALATLEAETSDSSDGEALS